MRWLGYSLKRVSSLRLPGEIAKRRKQQHVIELAADIAELGDEPINAPVFSKDGELIAGRDRLAAQLINGAKKIWIRIAEATEQERAALEASENLFRRVDDRNALIAARVHALSEQIAAKRNGTNVPLAVTRQDKTEAREKVARQAGITPAAVRKSEQRAVKDLPKNKEQIPASSGGDSTDAINVAPGGSGEPGTILSSGFAACPIDAHGIETSQAFNDHVHTIIVALEKAGNCCTRAQTELAALKDLPFPGALYQQLKAAAQTAAAQCRYAKPRTVCLYCRDPDGVALLRDNCNGCSTRGWLSEEQWAQIPRELFEKGAKPVTTAPSMAARIASDVRNGTFKGKATLRIEDENGDLLISIAESAHA